MSRSRRGPARQPAGSRPGRLTPRSPSQAADRPVLNVTQPSVDAEPDAGHEPQGLTATFCFDSGNAPGPYSATVRFAGERLGVVGRRDLWDGFTQEEVIENVMPHSGPVSVTARMYGINPGEWAVQAELVDPPPEAGKAKLYSRSTPQRGQVLQPAAWSWWKWRLVGVAPRPLKTRWSRLVLFDAQPAVVPGSWAGLVALGVVIGFVFQAILLPREHIAFSTVLPVSLVAVLAGVVGGKLWFIALHLRTWRAMRGDGFCIQGALVGAVAVGVGAVALLHLPIAVVLDATAPGLFLGVAVGRLGCFFTGCCAGRPSASRFAAWSSDRRVGARRIPTQPLESLVALSIGLVGLLVVLRYRLAVPGAVFVASMSAYTLGRQFILRLRAEHRRSSLGGPATALAAALVLAVSIVWLVLSAR
jgi:phosphatidylglycerol:prolipoprotein diacylglycerol transferase